MATDVAIGNLEFSQALRLKALWGAADFVSAWGIPFTKLVTSDLPFTKLVRKCHLVQRHQIGVHGSMAKQDDYVRYTIRVPGDLYRRVQDAAGEKSVNAEIVQRLEQSFETDDVVSDPDQLQAALLPITKAIATLMDEKYSGRLDQVQTQLAEVKQLLVAGALSDGERRDIREAVEDAADAATYAERTAALERGEDSILPPEVSALIQKGANRYRALRDWRGLTVNQLAKQSGFRLAALKQLEAGEVTLAELEIELLAKALNVPVQWVGN